MKILLDEQLPVKLKYRFNPILSVSTVRDMKWLGVNDQDLFVKIKDENFDLFITNDQNLKFQVNKKKISFSFLDLNFNSNRYDDLLPVMPLLNRELIKLAKTLVVSKKDSNNIYIFFNSGFKEWQNFEE